MSHPLGEYESRRAVLIEYLRMKVGMEDWHGVADAANDLRELDAEQRGRESKSEISFEPGRAA